MLDTIRWFTKPDPDHFRPPHRRRMTIVRAAQQNRLDKEQENDDRDTFEVVLRISFRRA
jgi:hypothetical protein